MDDVRVVMDSVASRRAAIMGVSEGGLMTALFAATYPERTAAATLYGTGARYIKAPLGPDARRVPSPLRRAGAQAEPGEVLVSSAVKDLVAGSGIRFRERGVAQLKGVPGEWRL